MGVRIAKPKLVKGFRKQESQSETARQELHGKNFDSNGTLQTALEPNRA